MNRVLFDEDRAKAVLSAINDAYQKQQGIYRDFVLPEKRWPMPKNAKQRGIWLFFCSLLMRGALISESPFGSLNWLWDNRKQIFLPTKNQEFSPELVLSAFREASQNIDRHIEAKGDGSLAFKELEFARHWHHNAVVLKKIWHGDIRNVYRDVEDFEEAFARIDYRRQKENGFYGMRRKIFSLLTIWLQNEELIPVFPTPIPVDFHAMRILWSTECLSFAKSRPFIHDGLKPEAAQRWQENFASWAEDEACRIHEHTVNEIALWSQSFLPAIGLSHLDINPALWLLSRDLCSGHLQNRTVGENKIATPQQLKRLDHWPKKYQDPCSFCPVSSWCKFSVPSAPYYRTGCLVRQPRVTYPGQTFLPGMEFAGKRRSAS